jgi:integrase
MASIRQRGSKYHVQVRRRAYGSITRSFSTKRDAEAWARLMEVKLGIEDLHFHDLRHEAISRLFELGLSAPEVSIISGHRDARMLLRYAHGDSKKIHKKFDCQSNKTHQI